MGIGLPHDAKSLLHALHGKPIDVDTPGAPYEALNWPAFMALLDDDLRAISDFLGKGGGGLDEAAVIFAAANTPAARKAAADAVITDASSWQAAWSSTVTGNQTVLLLEGTYPVDGTIFLPPNTRVIGTGSGTVLDASSTLVSTFVIENGCEFGHFRVIGGNNLAAVFYDQRSTYGTHVFFHDLIVTTAYEVIRGTQGVIVTSCQLTGTRIPIGPSDVFTANVLNGLVISSVTGDAAAMLGHNSITGNVQADGCIVVGNVIQGGVLNSSSPPWVVSGNSLVLPSDRGIELNLSGSSNRGISICDNFVDRPNTTGIFIFGSGLVTNKILIANNRINGANRANSTAVSNSGIYVQYNVAGGVGPVIMGNRISDAPSAVPRYALYLANANIDTAIVVGNDFRGTYGVGPVFNGGTNTQFSWPTGTWGNNFT